MPPRRRRACQIEIEIGYAWLPQQARGQLKPEIVWGIEVDHEDQDYCLAQCTTIEFWLLAKNQNAPGHLPLLEFVLRELWRKRQDRVLHRPGYDAMDQAGGAIPNRTEAVFAELSRMRKSSNPSARPAIQ